MAISEIGGCFHQARQLCVKDKSDRETIKAYAKSTTATVLHVADMLLGVTLVVLGILAYLQILPLPVGMVEPFAFAAIAGGAVNILAVALRTCLQVTGCDIKK